MRRFASARWAFALALLGLAGCADNSLVMRGQIQQAQQQQLAMSRQNEELQKRAGALDQDNRELSSLLAQSRQQSKIMEDQVTAMRDQLGGVTAQLAQVREEKSSSESRVQALTASMRRHGGVSIDPNNSFQESLPAINLSGVQVRRDGDVIRIELPGDELFQNGTPQLRQGGQRLITDVAGELVRTYPGHMIGVEGHTDSDRPQGGQWQTNHQLSLGRAAAVYDVLVNQARLQPAELFIVAHGANHPVVSNATSAGKQRNRRVELVVYPERSRR